MADTIQSPHSKLLYPAMQKFYSALSNLEKFNKGNNLFENISCLDCFFSEYRNVTFVLQKSLANTEYFHIYEKNRDKYLNNDICKWFVTKRNEVLKEHPFLLEKRLLITVYTPKTSYALPVKIFTVENDVKPSILINSLKSFFVKVNKVEVFFSVEFSFYEEGVNKELYDDLITGINVLKEFLLAMKNDLNENSNLCNELQQKINKLNFYQVPKNILFIEDYVYYCQENAFGKSNRLELIPHISEKGKPILLGMERSSSIFFSKKEDDFFNFIIMYLTIFDMQKTLMPTFMILYKNDTFELISYLGSIKTTTYRKINEIASRIEEGSIKSVFYVTEMIKHKKTLTNSLEILNINASRKIEYGVSESLCFFSINSDLDYQSFTFDSDKISNLEYIASIFRNKTDREIEANFLQPLITEFKRLVNP